MGVSPVWVGEPELTLGHSGQKRFPAAERKESAPGCHCCSGGKGRWVIISFSPFFFLRGRTKLWLENSPCVLHPPLMSWCVSGSGWIFGCWGEAFTHSHQDSPQRFLSCTHPSLQRWDEFGQNRRGSESPAGPRRGPRVSFTENFEQQSRNFRELKQRVFRHRVGRYTVRVLLKQLDSFF